MDRIISFIILFNFIVLYIYYKKTKNICNIAFILQIFIFVHVFFFYRKWSGFIDNKQDISFDIIIISLLVIFYLGLIFSKKIDYKKIESIKSFSKTALYLYNIIFVILTLIETYLVTGTIAPSIYGIDAHQLSVPIVNIITRNLGLVLILNFIYYTFRRKKFVIFLNIIYIIYFFIFRSARMVVFCAFIQLLIFIIIYYNNKLNLKKISIGLIVSIVLVIGGVAIGNYRMSDYGRYDVNYGEAIKYNGPNDKFGIMSSYYGYFPMSFENLDLSIKKAKANNATTYGLNTLAPVLVGIFKLNNTIYNYPYIEYINENRAYNVGEATVPTGFFEFYLDFGNFIILGLILYIFITIYFYNRIKKNIFYIFAYSVMGSAWAMMSFQNMLIIPNTLYQIIIFWAFDNLFIGKRLKFKYKK